MPLSSTVVMRSTTTTTAVSNSRTKASPNITAHIPAQTEEVHSSDYVDSDDFEAYQNEEHQDAETTSQDDSQAFDEKLPDRNSIIPGSNNRKGATSLSTSRMPFVPANLWRDLFSKPGILVGRLILSSASTRASSTDPFPPSGIIGGVVIGMLSAILLVMFIIYRMRKKDEGSYALEEGPRKSPSHAYTRVSSREFFA